MTKTISPMTKLPPITKSPKASMTWPAAAVPSWPCARIRRVEATLSASRSMVAISSTVGKAENSSGVSMNSAVIRISTDRMIETASSRSSRTGGSGTISTTRMPITDGERDVGALQQGAEIVAGGEAEEPEAGVPPGVALDRSWDALAGAAQAVRRGLAVAGEARQILPGLWLAAG